MAQSCWLPAAFNSFTLISLSGLPCECECVWGRERSKQTRGRGRLESGEEREAEREGGRRGETVMCLILATQCRADLVHGVTDTDYSTQHGSSKTVVFFATFQQDQKWSGKTVRLSPFSLNPSSFPSFLSTGPVMFLSFDGLQ